VAVVVLMPADHFSRPPGQDSAARRHPALRWTLIVLKNVAGLLIVPLGVIMALRWSRGRAWSSSSWAQPTRLSRQAQSGAAPPGGRFGAAFPEPRARALRPAAAGDMKGEGEQGPS
jgi:hypothetical protein